MKSLTEEQKDNNKAADGMTVSGFIHAYKVDSFYSNFARSSTHFSYLLFNFARD